MAKATKWLVKSENGRELGPYTTDVILRMISEGALSGLEKIKKYPEGKWITFSSRPDFYDKILEVLEKEASPDLVKKNTNKNETTTSDNNSESQEISDKTTIKRPDEKQIEMIKNSIEVQKKQEEELVNKAKIIVPKITYVESYNTEENSELLKAKQSALSKASIKRSYYFAIFYFSISFALLYLSYQYFFDDQIQQTKSIYKLKIPQGSSQKKLSIQEQKTILLKAKTLYAKDTFESLAEAQDLVVNVIESANLNKDARGFLCLIYRELWPYVSQEADDLSAVKLAHQGAKTIDAIGINSFYCDYLRLLIDGKTDEARGILDHALNDPKHSTSPILYEMKSEILAFRSDYDSVSLYAEKSFQLWPEWIKPRLQKAKFLIQSGQNSKVKEIFDFILKQNSEHRVAGLEYGIFEYKVLKKIDESQTRLEFYTALNQKAPITLEGQAYFTLAQIYFEKRNVALATEFIKIAKKKLPNNKMIAELYQKITGEEYQVKEVGQVAELISLGDQYQKTGNCFAAQAQFKAAFKLDPKNAVAAMKAGVCLWELSLSLEAIQWVRKAIEADDKLVRAHLLLAEYLSNRYDTNSAINTLNKINSKAPNNPEIFRQFAAVELRRGRVKEAKVYIEKSLRLFDNDIESQIVAAKVLAVAGDFQGSQKYAIRAIELDSTNSEAQIIYSKILSKFRGGDVALAYLKDLIAKYSYSINYRQTYAEILMEQTKYSEALNVLEQIISIQPKSKLAKLAAGTCLKMIGKNDQAIQYFLDSVVIDPSDPEGLFKAAQLYFELGKLEDAKKYAKRTLQTIAQFPGAYLLLAKINFKENQYKEALENAHTEKKYYPENVEVYIFISELHSDQKNFQACTKEIQTGIKVRPQMTKLYIIAASCYRQSGSPDIAESMINIASGIESGHPELYREQAAVFEQKGDPRAAAVSYQKYLNLSPNAPDRKAVEARIQILNNRK
jgi:tetratricopeptide (TPR) repeat protein